MRRFCLTVAVLAVTAPAFAGEKSAHPAGTFIGHDGKLWKMEGCAAYPVDAAGKALPVASAPKATPAEAAPKKLAQSKPAKSE